MLAAGTMPPPTAAPVVKARSRARGHHTAGKMNGAETAYSNFLFALKQAGEILEFRFEQITLKLGQDLRYTPDFFVLDPLGCIEFHEVKAKRKSKKTGKLVMHSEDDSRAKIIAAAEMMPWFTFRIVWLDPVSGNWDGKTIE